MVALGYVEGLSRFDCGHNRLREGMAGVQFGDRLFGFAFLLFVGEEDDGAVLSANVVSLPIQSCGVMHGEENIQQVAITDDGGVILYAHDLDMARVSSAD